MELEQAVWPYSWEDGLLPFHVSIGIDICERLDGPDDAADLISLGPPKFCNQRQVIRWHRTGFRLYWKWISRKRVRVGRKPTSKELRELIFRMVTENRTWGAPRIHGELKMLGFQISERTVLRWMRKAPRDSEPARRWAAFLNNHREAIAAMDFFT